VVVAAGQVWGDAASRARTEQKRPAVVFPQGKSFFSLGITINTYLPNRSLVYIVKNITTRSSFL
jgi:diphthamide synthase subunit DPH2